MAYVSGAVSVGVLSVARGLAQLPGSLVHIAVRVDQSARALSQAFFPKSLVDAIDETAAYKATEYLSGS